MADEDDFLEGVTDDRLTVSVSLGQFQQLSRDQVRPGMPRLTHKLMIGPHFVPGVYVVVGAYRGPDKCTITLARLED